MSISQALHYNIQFPVIIVALFGFVQFLVEEGCGMILLAQHTGYAYIGGVARHLKYFREIMEAND